MHKNNLLQTFILLTLFSIAMGFMESAIVVYLRKIYYPSGFQFPLAPIDMHIGLTEILREAATLIMLLTIGIVSGKSKVQRFSVFIFCFAVWDIFYYVFLKLLINWPATLVDWDILFLIPVPWIGPVIAPCILSLTMIIYALAFTLTEKKNETIKIKTKEWLLMALGSLIIICSFVYDYIRVAFMTSASHNKELLADLSNYVPQQFQWSIFSAGEAILLLTLFFILKKNNAFSAASLTHNVFYKSLTH